MASKPLDRGGSSSSSGTPVALRLKLLGGFNVLLCGRQIPTSAFPRRKAMSLIKVLALSDGHQRHRDQLIELLWPELSLESANAQLYKAVHHARRAIESVLPAEVPDQLIQVRGDFVSLLAPGGTSTDVAEFEQMAREALMSRDGDALRQAAARYGGDLLPGDLYEPWAGEARTRLAECYVDVLVNLGESCLASGALAEAADVLRVAIVRDAAREDAHRALMLVYARQGNRARALRQFQICADSLHSELGADVSRATMDLHQQILDERVSPVDTAGSSSTLEPMTLPPLVGREQELGEVMSLIDDLGGGTGSVLSIDGMAGVGKTRFAQEILRLGWQRRWHVMYGAAHVHEAQTPYMPIVEALRMALWLDPSHASLIPAELAAAIPELPPSAVGVESADRLAAQSALFAGVLRFLSARSQAAPVILVLDNLDAFDAGSMRLFHYLARESARDARGPESGLRLMLVGVWRSNEPASGPGLDAVLSDLERRQILSRLSLGPLAERDHYQLLVQSIDGEPVEQRLAAQLYAGSEGNALFAREMVRQLVHDGRIVSQDGQWQRADEPTVAGVPMSLAIPTSLQALSRRKIEALDPAGRHAIQLASVIGRDVPLEIMEQCLEAESIAQPTVLDLIETLVDWGLLEEIGFNLRFPHPLLRDAIYDRLSLPRRKALHDTIGRMLESHYSSTPECMPVAELAYHYRNADNVERAVHFLLLAGDRAREVYDHDGALSQYYEARSMMDTSRVPWNTTQVIDTLERIGDTYRAIGDISRSLQSYQDALRHLDVEAHVDERLRFELHRKTTLGAILTVDMPVAGEHLGRARDLAGRDPIERARLKITESLFAWHALQFDDAIAHARDALQLAEAFNASDEVNQAYEMLALAHMPLGEWETAMRYELLRSTNDWSPEVVVAIDAHLCLYQYKLHSEASLQQSRWFIDSIARQADTIGNRRCLAVCHFVLGNLALLQGLPILAAESNAKALELHRKVGSPAGIAYSLAQQAELLTAAGVHDAVPALIKEGLSISERAAIRDHCLAQLYAAGIRNRLETGDDAGAAEFAEAARQHDAVSQPCAVCQVGLYESIASLHVQFGEPDLAMPLIAHAEHVAEMAMNLPGKARLTRLKSEILAQQGDLEGAEECLTQAAAIFEDVGDQYDLALTFESLSALGDRNRPGLRNQAREVLQHYRSPALQGMLRG